MLPKVLLNSLMATPALLGAALIASSAAIAADVQASTDVDALLNDSAAASDVDLSDLDALTEKTAATPSVAPVSQAAAVEAVPSASAIAEIAPEAQAPVQLAQSAPAAQAPVTSVSSLDQIMEYSDESASQAQVTSISQLSDVEPTDWAFQALQSLVERYGCIVGYPDRTYRGDRALTRFEFAAGLNACLDRISELIASSTADLATKEDLATLQRLQEEFAAELATLRGRVDALEARTSELEANQFSTTTKLNGETIFAAGVPIDDDDNLGDDQTIAGYRVRLNFDTSFTGEDLLRARIQAREFGDFDSFGNSVAWSFGGLADETQEADGLRLDDLVYIFPLGERITASIGLNSWGDSDFVASTISPFDSSGFGSLTNFGTPAQYNFIPGGTGAGLIFQLTDNLSLDFGYAADNAGNPNEKNGLFNGDYGAIAQLTFLSDFVDLGVMYANAYQQDGFGFGGNSTDRAEVANIYGAQVNFKISDGFEIGGGAAYMPVRVLERGDYDVWSYNGTIAFPDLGGDGNLLGFVAGQPARIAGTSPGAAASFDGGLTSGFQNARRLRAQDAAFVVEGFYRFRINDNIAITPGLVWLNNPSNDEGFGDTFVGAIRTTFTF